MNPKISILLPAYKSADLLFKIFLSSFRKNCSANTEVVIYDNGDNGLFLNCFVDRDIHEIEKNVYVIGKGENIGLNAALNECAKVAKGDYFYLCHTDMHLLPNWDAALLEACRNLPPASFLLCSRSIEPVRGHTDFHIIRDYGKEWNEFREKELLSDFKEYRDNTIVTGFRMPFLLHRKLWEKMDGVDPNYFSYCTDDDLVQTAYDKNVRRFWMVYDSLIYHLQGKSNKQQNVDRNSDAPYKYFVEKWRERGYNDAEHPGQWHPKLIPWYNKIR